MKTTANTFTSEIVVMLCKLGFSDVMCGSLFQKNNLYLF